MIARIALPERLNFSVSQLVRDVHPQLRSVMIPRKTNGHMSLLVGQTVIQMAAPAKPVTVENLDRVLQFSSRWSIDRKAWESHSAQLVFAISGEDEPAQQAKILTAVVAAALKQSPDAIGVFWKSAGQIIPRDLFCQIAGQTGHMNRLWIGVHTGHAESGTIGRTQGMAALGKQEVETIKASEPPQKVASRLIELVRFLVNNDREIQDGQWLERSNQQNIRLRIFHQSAFGSPGPVIRMVYGAVAPDPSTPVNTGREPMKQLSRDSERKKIWRRPAFGIAVAAVVLAGIALTVAVSL